MTFGPIVRPREHYEDDTDDAYESHRDGRDEPVDEGGDPNE
ncbi:hypothetical protein [Agromyces atrinae]|nr:hypothetical protein [Agromyces atrinae]